MNEKTLQFICVSGFGYSGSGAVIDILGEFDSHYVFNKEFRLIKDPDGIIDLEDALVNNWQELKSDIAIRRFRRLINVTGRKQKLFSKFGYNFNEIFNNQFYAYEEDYINELVDIQWKGDWPYHLHEFNWLKLFFYRLKRSFGLNPYEKDIMYFSYPGEKFYITTKIYLNNLFLNIVDCEKYNTVVLDQALPPYRPQKYLDYFHKVKIIVVDRDPRDVFVELSQFPSYPSQPVERFIKYFKCQRNAVTNASKSNNVLQLKFEDLIFNYENILKKIYNFLGFNEYHHSKKMMFFQPKKSLNNFGKWKEWKALDDIQKIEKELSPFLYNN